MNMSQQISSSLDQLVINCIFNVNHAALQQERAFSGGLEGQRQAILTV